MEVLESSANSTASVPPNILAYIANCFCSNEEMAGFPLHDASIPQRTRSQKCTAGCDLRREDINLQVTMCEPINRCFPLVVFPMLPCI